MPTLQALAAPSSDPRGTWLSQNYRKKLNGSIVQLVAGIGWLPLTWIDASLVTDKAVKTDKASVPVHLWDQWICLPMGITSPNRFASLVILRNLYYKVYQNRLIASCCKYMTDTYGYHWIYWLSQVSNLKRYYWLVRGQLKLLRGGMFPVSQNAGTSIPVLGSRNRKSSSVLVLCSYENVPDDTLPKL